MIRLERKVQRTFSHAKPRFGGRLLSCLGDFVLGVGCSTASHYGYDVTTESISPWALVNIDDGSYPAHGMPS